MITTTIIVVLFSTVVRYHTTFNIHSLNMKDAESYIEPLHGDFLGYLIMNFSYSFVSWLE